MVREVARQLAKTSESLRNSCSQESGSNPVQKWPNLWPNHLALAPLVQSPATSQHHCMVHMNLGSGVGDNGGEQTISDVNYSRLFEWTLLCVGKIQSWPKQSPWPAGACFQSVLLRTKMQTNSSNSACTWSGCPMLDCKYSQGHGFILSWNFIPKVLSIS